MEGNNNLKIFKICLVGESGVGKTCIINRFVKNEFTIDESPTLAASYAQKNVKLDDDTIIRFHIWDTAGQEEYRSIAKIFYKDAKAAILVYDITNQKSFDEIKNYWYEQIKNNTQENINKSLFYLI